MLSNDWICENRLKRDDDERKYKIAEERRFERWECFQCQVEFLAKLDQLLINKLQKPMIFNRLEMIDWLLTFTATCFVSQRELETRYSVENEKFLILSQSWTCKLPTGLSDVLAFCHKPSILSFRQSIAGYSSSNKTVITVRGNEVNERFVVPGNSRLDSLGFLLVRASLSQRQAYYCEKWCHVDLHNLLRDTLNKKINSNTRFQLEMLFR